MIIVVEGKREEMGRKKKLIYNGERLIKMTAFKKTRGLLFELLKMSAWSGGGWIRKASFLLESRQGALSNGSHVYCHKIIFYLHLLL